MFFQIRQLILWPKPKDVEPKFKSVLFELGKVNVITGESRTGKSAIILIRFATILLGMQLKS